MESSDKRSCFHDGRSYSHGSEICEFDRCMECRDGKWEETYVNYMGTFGP